MPAGRRPAWLGEGDVDVYGLVAPGHEPGNGRIEVRDTIHAAVIAPSAAAGNVRPVATPGTHSRRTGRKPKYVQYE
ncbi:hypothetical protein, partial [Streptomyces griseoruber]|uniref:hypothetical protein n=1 Tax=Streptomyces griseoruber TaxID=1943 RepID=UPI003797DB10